MRLIDTELYELAIALADENARGKIIHLCAEKPFRTYHTKRASPSDMKKVEQAARYLELREASGEPMPYKVVRDGDKVRFDVPAPPKDGE